MKDFFTTLVNVALLASVLFLGLFGGMLFNLDK